MRFFDKFWSGIKNIPEGFDYVFRGNRPGSFPDEGPSGDIQARAKASDTPESARDLIDEIIGTGATDATLARRLDGIVQAGRTFSLINAQLSSQQGALTPFSESGDALAATGGASVLGRAITPYKFTESRLDQLFKDDPRAKLLYLREFEPESLLPVLIEQDTDKFGGGKKW